MKIALLVPEMNVGGVEQGAFDLARGFVKRGHTVILLSAGGRMIPEVERCGVKHIYFSFHKKNPYSFLISLKRLINLIKKEKIDIVHARSRFPAWVAYFACKNNPETHFITSIHGFYKKKFYSQVMGKGERVIVISNSLKKYAINYLKTDKEKIRVIYNGIDIENFKGIKKVPHDEFVIGCIGRLTKVKGFQYVLYAVAEIKEKMKNLKVIIVGEGEMFDYLNRIKEEENLYEVEFKKGRAVEFLPYIDLLIAPHLNPENISNSKLWIGRAGVEAQIAGIPVITTAEGIQKGDFLIGKYNIFVSPMDIEGLKKAIVFAYENYSGLKPMVEKAREYVIENFSVDRMVEDTLKVYEELL